LVYLRKLAQTFVPPVVLLLWTSVTKLQTTMLIAYTLALLGVHLRSCFTSSLTQKRNYP